MKSALAIRHLHFEDLGTLECQLRKRGYQLEYADAAQDDLLTLDTQSPDLLIVLGGPIGVCDEYAYPFLLDELAVVRHRLTSKAAILGICLGAQLIARALGSKVYPMGSKEIGFSPITLTEAGRQSPLAAIGTAPVLHWHGDQFDIPAEAVHLASTSLGPHQAFAVGSKVLALQFHLEANAHQIEHWLIGHASELAQAHIAPGTLRAQAQQYAGRLAAVAEKVFGAWLDGIVVPQADYGAFNSTRVLMPNTRYSRL